MRNAAVVAAAGLCAVCFTGAGLVAQTPSARQSTSASSSAKSGSAAVSATDREFINDLTIAGKTEIQLGQLTNEHAASEDVKAFGQLMVRDHTQAGMELMQIASQLKVQPPAQFDSKHKELLEKLSKLQGAAFDKEYMAAMVKGHHEVEDMLSVRAGVQETRNVTPNTPASGDQAGVRDANSGGVQTSTGNTGAAAIGTSGTVDGDPALTQWARKTLPTVRQHLQRAEQIQKDLK